MRAKSPWFTEEPPFTNYLKKNEKKETGWLRDVLCSSENKQKYLRSREISFMLFIGNMLLSLPTLGGESNGWVRKYTDAWGISKNSLNNQFKNFIGKGVIPVPLPMEESETAQAKIINEKTSRGLK